MVIPVSVQLAPGLAPASAGDNLRTAGGLSWREREVLGQVALGRTDAQVARELGISPATVSKHLHNVYQRLGLPNRAAAVDYLLRNSAGMRWQDQMQEGDEVVGAIRNPR